ncbi:MAG: class I SAM-dependent methyltransferase [Acidimicrobiales bacterium]
MRTFSLVACPSCAHTGSTTVSVGSTTLCRCAGCGLIYAREYADPDSIYVDGYLTGATEFGPPDVLNPIFQEFLVYAGHQRMARAEAVVGGPGSMLDVGCGSGDVLVAATDRGWRAVGAEPVPESAEAAVARGLEVHCAMLQDSGVPEASFDLVTAYHVLEHMADSTGFLRLIARWARPGGHVLVEVPNWRSVHRRAGGEQWIGLRPLEHIGHYTPKTLRDTIARAGLEPVKVATMGFPWEAQTFREALSDVGLNRFAGRLRRLSRQAPLRGDTLAVPNRAGWALVKGLLRAYDAAKIGQVVYAIGRVPT